MDRKVRCQGIILKDGCILILKQYNYRRKEEYWMLPGGGLENNETEEECIKREIEEETNLAVDIIEVLFDDNREGSDVYKRYVTFLCIPKKDSVEKIGTEMVSYRKILELVWCPLDDEGKWNDNIKREQFFPSMKRIKDKLISMGVI
ncbi:NUDIX domain-containing protein [Proteiniborus ethanoligenes]|uniref:NUDIX domain-containing protein n=1 Tax=Proteiniborus ethanoligenes TaxID=415015 RepID=A0A1H3KKI3_9FIRM|nr:NUDIX hydrolase [Proteiniborus ethanoligenes]SDY52693.1 NUDIX domain-containing protein [Proteiniborus ethanoligenes]